MSSSEARRIHIEAWQTSGMSQAAYCREHGLNTKTFGNWVRKHRAGQVNRSLALVPVTIKPMPSIELDHLNLTPEAKTEVSNLIQSLLTQAQNELKLLEAKNQALKLELAHLRRIRFGAKSEAEQASQRLALEERTADQP